MSRLTSQACKAAASKGDYFDDEEIADLIHLGRDAGWKQIGANAGCHCHADSQC